MPPYIVISNGRGTPTDKAPSLAPVITPTPSFDAGKSGPYRPPTQSAPATTDGAITLRSPTEYFHGPLEALAGAAMTPASTLMGRLTLPSDPHHTAKFTTPLQSFPPVSGPCTYWMNRRNFFETHPLFQSLTPHARTVSSTLMMHLITPVPCYIVILCLPPSSSALLSLTVTSPNRSFKISPVIMCRLSKPLPLEPFAP